mmetsp:Transcript_3414/g.6543  ORF Transcript_3414/g.6543 Transcript_3414/m.6543 type:complete len:458 (+) Transcript_3414:153-1526(+)|eukprot:CAMPEP_0203746656 /NCGR_PEP_ID=MMETSP0098-20131031/2031_1 /ASSEMBLY_ACC=CAM_ASM_000208 /TAXON_ID=96639 /ORGANISM=" , Strain NY0313808BC1" /LENGTH=457 /DNA_ID=CAMNT_0050634831 /DNA_START=133 /DNA_END=1506 /DNA_ORIENTATION=-
MGYVFGVEVAKSGRAKCKKCGEKIEKDAVRWTRQIESEDMSFQAGNAYMHLDHLIYPKRAGLEFKDIKNVEDFPEDEQRSFRTAYENAKEEYTTKKPKTTKVKREAAETDGSSAKKRKTKKGPHPDLQVEKKSKSKRDETMEEISSDPVVLKYKKLVISQLKEYLRFNQMLLTGTKDELVARCVDGEKYGRLKGCPACGKGLLRLSERGTILCKGYFDDSINMRLTCNFEKDAKDVPREKWLEPSVDAPLDEDGNQESAKENLQLNEQDEAKVKDLLESLYSEDISNRDAANKLVEVSRKMDVNVPTDDSAARQKAGTALMSHRREEGGFDGLGAFKQLQTELGSKTKSLADKKKKLEARMPANVPANTNIANALEELGELEGKAKEGANYQFKVKALKKAAIAIRNCDFEVTSGKLVSAGKQKLDGVGPGTGKKIQELLDSGSIQRLEDLRKTHLD